MVQAGKALEPDLPDVLHRFVQHIKHLVTAVATDVVNDDAVGIASPFAMHTAGRTGVTAGLARTLECAVQFVQEEGAGVSIICSPKACCNSRLMRTRVSRTVSLAAARASHHNFGSDNAFSATMAPRSREIPRSTAAIHGEHAD